MKSLKKLITASLMLVIAFVGVVASTFAWFTMQNQVTVDDLQLEVGVAGRDLQISLDGTNFGYRVALAPLPVDEGETLGFKLKPVTYRNDSLGGWMFNTLALDEEGVYEYDSTQSLLYNGTTWDGTAGTSSFFEFDAWFVSSAATISAPLVVRFDAYAFEGALSALTLDGQAFGALRVKFAVYDELEDEFVDVIIYEPNYATASAYDNDTNLIGTFGTGSFYNDTKKFISNTAFAPFVQDTLSTINGEDHYVLEASVLDEKYEHTYFESASAARSADLTVTYGTTARFIDIVSLQSANASQVRITIWLEGWDGDATNEIATQNLAARLLFVGDDAE